MFIKFKVFTFKALKASGNSNKKAVVAEERLAMEKEEAIRGSKGKDTVRIENIH